MKQYSVLLFLTALVFFVADLSYSDSLPVNSLDELLERVTQGKTIDFEENEKRLEKFRRAQSEQENLLNSANEETSRLESTGENFNRTIAENDRFVASLEDQLNKALGNFGELFGVTRQVAGDTQAQIKGSLISSQFPGRESVLSEMSKSKELPTMEQLRHLWVVLLQEQTEQGRIARYTSSIAGGDGRLVDTNVIRFGAFTAISDDGFLVFDESTQQLSGLPRQPDRVYTKNVRNFIDSGSGQILPAVIDPSRGTILGLVIQAPSLLDRFHQGGLPGYVVSGLAVIGLSIGLFRLVVLWFVGSRVNRQIRSKKMDLNNPLGRVLDTYDQNPNVDLETLELKMDDAVLKEIPKLDRGLSTLKVLAAVAPLIGLLGTVVGMILTFQAITLWGTGEPKIMAGGISQALVTTVQGLVAAIPLLLLHNFTQGRAKLIQQVLEEQSAGLIARCAEERHG